MLKPIIRFACMAMTGMFALPLYPASGWGMTPHRFAENPIIQPNLIPEDHFININGPTLILTPDWLPHRLGKYYLYFANHRGNHIHLAYADRLEGPWKLAHPAPLFVQQVAEINHEVANAKSHVGSPDIYLDEEKHEIRMYFHFKLPKLGHVSSVAVSKDGLQFEVQPGTIGQPYLRHFKYDGWFYFIDRKGSLMRSRDGFTHFEMGPNQIFQATQDPLTHAKLRHTGVKLKNNQLQVFFSRVGDAPESIFFTTLKLDGDWTQWKVMPPQLVLFPDTVYEGNDLPIVPSKKGDTKGQRRRELRDPYLYEENGNHYLLYSVAGEYGIGIAQLVGLP